jgi:uncharacterized protein YifE (UPF0438 family)
MSTRQDHQNYIKAKGTFTIDCNRCIFSKEETEILEKWGHWFQALADGELDPLNEDQDHFVQVARMEAQPVTEFEHAWFKYTNRKRIEAKNPERFEKKDYHAATDPFYSREQAKQMKRRQFGNIAKLHRE